VVWDRTKITSQLQRHGRETNLRGCLKYLARYDQEAVLEPYERLILEMRGDE
jgi:hypothetical protein